MGKEEHKYMLRLIVRSVSSWPPFDSHEDPKIIVIVN